MNPKDSCKMEENHPVLIVGQGLAGTIMALTLDHYQIPFRIIDDPKTTACSQVAAGLFNPITGRKMKKTWMAEPLFEYLHSFYPLMEKKLGTHFFHAQPIFRPFLSIEDQNDMSVLFDQPAFTPFIEKFYDHPFESELVKSPLGGVLLKQTGWLDIPTFLASARKYFLDRGWFQEGRLMEQDIVDEGNEGLKIPTFFENQSHFSKIIFTTGVHNQHWSWFKHLPFKPVKGEIIEVETKAKPPVIFNRGVFCVPLKNGVCRIGATYNWREYQTGISESGKEELIEKAKNLLNFDFEVVKHTAGIRPATKDRRPFVGWENGENQGKYGVFTGLGSKGVSLAPFFANEWVANWANDCDKNDVRNITKDGYIHPEVNINRYNSLS